MNTIMNSFKIKFSRLSVINGMICACLSSCLFLAGCGGSGGDEPVPDPTIQANVSSVALPATGGERSFTVATDAGNWNVTSSGSWLQATREGNSVKLQCGLNSGVLRSATVQCSVVGGSASTSVSITQSELTGLQNDSLALADLFGASGSPSNPLAHAGVTVSGGNVTGLDLKNAGLSGAIPASIGKLTHLQYCDLSGNNFTGSLPPEIGELKDLEYLDLSGNKLTGAAPGMASLTKLVVLDLSSNGLTALPALSSNLPALEYLAFNGNKLSGNLPAGWSAYTKLVYVDLSANAFTGVIPDAWSALSSLKALHLYGNALSGDIPLWLAGFAGLQSLALNHNSLSGTVPAGLGALPQLETLWLSHNRLTGEIPASLSDNSRWNEWKSMVCPQQDGYGFSNCTGGSSGSAPGKAAGSHVKNAYREKYRRN